MNELLINDETIRGNERNILTLSQIIVLAAYRQFKSYNRVAKFLHRDEPSIRMMVMRIRKRGVTV